MCLLGGWYTFAGPMVGAALIVGLRTVVSIYTDYWTLILGVLLILLIFFLPDGVMGYLLERFRPRAPMAEVEAGPIVAVQERGGG
jgi:branched-chain amino acid transport system permease protein